MYGDVWYPIPGFNGYEITNDGKVRSMKMMHANPGNLMKVANGKVALTSSIDGSRVRISIKELLDITFNSGKTILPRLEHEVDYTSRNKVLVKDKPKKISNEQVGMSFNRLIEEDPIICPISYI